MSYSCDYDIVFNLLNEAIKITRPSIDLNNISRLFLTETELLILIEIEQAALYKGDTLLMNSIHTQICHYIDRCQLAEVDKEFLSAKNAIPFCKYLIHTKKYDQALDISEKARYAVIFQPDTGLLLEITFLNGLSHFFLNHSEKAHDIICSAVFSADALNSCYSTACVDYLSKYTDFQQSEYMQNTINVPLEAYPVPEPYNYTTLGFGEFDILSPDIYTLGTLIKEQRIQKGITQDTLCYGICSKSKLSKIENNLLQPDIALAEVLLQRVGISERIFTFWGDEKDALFYNLKFKTLCYQLDKDIVKECIDKMADLIKPSDKLYYQQCVSFKTLIHSDTEQIISIIKEALNLTLPDFDINAINSYRLSQKELMLLRELGMANNSAKDTDIWINHFEKLILYSDLSDNDIIFKSGYFPSLISTYIIFLCINTNLQLASSVYNKYKDSIVYNFYNYGTILLLLCQIMIKNHDEAGKKYAVYACNIHYLYDLTTISRQLRDFLLSEYDINLQY